MSPLSLDQLTRDTWGSFDPLVIAQTLRQSLLGSMLLWSLYGDLTLEQRVQNVFDVIWNGISASPAHFPSASGVGDGNKQ